ncbi:MlaD family protein [Nocardia miyunensis]|uniref:MlaD family protein n=1 Tax=Nocardia miyunensis TaxID=282684 RepID=UPI001FDFC90D|nr:MlaD family protein [Nocardia miyunensis]
MTSRARMLLRPSTVRTALSGAGRDLRWGIAGIGAVILLIVAIGVIDIVGTTPARTYTAEVTDAQSVRTGDDVRIAGIPVGKVTSVALLRDRVRMKFTVQNGVFLGDQTTLGIRMLTIVGGYYVAVEPAGTQPLGSKVIPAQRVILPYNLTQAFQDAITPIQNADGDVIRQDLAALSSSVNASPDALRVAIRAAGDLTGIMDRQNADISRTLSMADEYLTALNKNADVLVRLLTTFRTLEVLVANNRDQLNQALHWLAEVVQDFSPFGRAWDRSLKARAQPLADAIPKLQELGGKMNALLDSLRTLEQRLVPFTQSGNGVTVDQSAATTTDICVPIPGGGC